MGPKTPVLQDAAVDPALLALIERCSFGYTRRELELALLLGPTGYVEYHLAPEAIDDSDLEARLAPLPTLAMTPQQLAMDAGTHHPVQELKHAALLRAVYSKRQLFERVVEFWTDHFSIYIKDGSVRMLKPTDDRDVVRKHAFGRFADLLRASMHSAAMLMYLDNDENRKDGPNENYARELMELHTLGVDGGYQESDVKEAARCLTGWRFLPLGSGSFGTFAFAAEDHDDGPKQVLQHVFPGSNGIKDGEDLAALLIAHPATPRFVGAKLARFLLRAEPSAALIDQVVAVWHATGGNVRALVRTILSPAALAAEQPWLHRKLKRPFHFAVSLLRVLGAELPLPPTLLQPGPLTEELRILGQEPFEWPTPNGYPDLESTWGSTLLARWSFASRLLAGEMAGASIDPNALLVALAGTGAAGWGHALDVLLTGGRMTRRERRLLDGYGAAAGLGVWQDAAERLALAASTESFQRY